MQSALVSQKRLFPNFKKRLQLSNEKDSIIVPPQKLTTREQIRQAIEEIQGFLTPKMSVKEATSTVKEATSTVKEATSTPKITVKELLNKLSDRTIQVLKAVGFIVAAPVGVGLGAAGIAIGTATAGAAPVIVVVGGVAYIVSAPFLKLIDYLKSKGKSLIPRSGDEEVAVAPTGVPRDGTQQGTQTEKQSLRNQLSNFFSRNKSLIEAADPALVQRDGTATQGAATQGAKEGTATQGYLSNVFNKLALLFSRTSEIVTKTPEEIFKSLPDEIKNDLIKLNYTADSKEFAALVKSLKKTIHNCDETQCIDQLINGNDRLTLKVKLEGILKKLDLNAEDEFSKFQKRVIELLSDRFSLFAKFQEMVLDELYKIGVPQIPLVDIKSFQILNGDEIANDEAALVDVFDKMDYDKI
jgi:hypothetical protein